MARFFGKILTIEHPEGFEFESDAPNMTMAFEDAKQMFQNDERIWQGDGWLGLEIYDKGE